MSSDPTKSSPPVIVVSGDLCIDWLSIPVESMVAEPEAELMNWQLRDGRHMYAVLGGAWLTAAFTREAVGPSAIVIGQKPEPHPENVPPDDIIHSMLMLGPSDRERDNKKEPHWVVTHFEGFAGPDDDKSSRVTGVERKVPGASIVLLDDAGNGFRDRQNVWPAELSNESRPLVLYKVRRPLCKGKLWKRLTKTHLPRTIALLGADELRGEGGSISRGLSWERSSTDLVLTLDREPGFEELRQCPFIIITFGNEAALLVRCADGRIRRAQLYYLPNLTEGSLCSGERGNMSGFGSAFAAKIAAALVGSAARKTGDQQDAIERALRKGVPKALALMDTLLEHAFGPCRMEHPKLAGKTAPRPPEYPIKEIFKASGSRPLKVREVALPDLPKRAAKELSRFRSWRILDSRRDVPFRTAKHLTRYRRQPKETSAWLFSDLAAEVVKRGVDKVFADVPIGRFKKLVTLDRSEIESYRSIKNLIQEFLNTPRPERPLCLAVFGPPGGGKSFGVTQVAKSLDAEGRIEPLTFNVSQWDGAEYLVNALHRVRDSAISEKVPLVFFDEFDSQFQGQRFGWLKYFLAPMQDGVFADGLYTHTIGKAIFVFAGGTSATYAEFRKAATAEATSPSRARRARVNNTDDLTSAKLPDFDSRLRGHVDVFGLDPPTDTNLLRRALVLRGNIEKSHKDLIDADGKVRMGKGVLRAFLQAPSYYHGARSLEAILDMSHLVGRTDFDPSLLPPQHQLDLHVDGAAFMALVQHQPALAPVINALAKPIHRLYFVSETDKDDQGKPIPGEPGSSLVPWDELVDVYKWSSREQAAYYPSLLAAAGCSFEEEGRPDAEFKFSKEEIEKLARMEHDRWTEERRIKQPEHPDRVPWEQLDREEQEKDVRTVKEIPKFLGKVGLRVVRL